MTIPPEILDVIKSGNVISQGILDLLRRIDAQQQVLLTETAKLIAVRDGIPLAVAAARLVENRDLVLAYYADQAASKADATG